MDNAALNLSKRVLVVDDDESIRDLCAMVLRTAGYKVDLAAHGGEGLVKLSQSDYDLVISDVNMPELGGVEFHEAAMSLPGQRRAFLFMSGGASEEVFQAISERGLKCLEKPFRISELIDAVEEMMSGSLSAALAARETGSRKEGRLSFTDLCSVVSAAGSVAGVARDISPRGMRAEYAGEPIRAGEDVLVKVSLRGLTFERGARMVWTERAGAGFVSGIEFREPMPVSSIVNIMAGGR